MLGRLPDLDYVLRRFRRRLLPTSIAAVVVTFAVGAFAFISGGPEYQISFKISVSRRVLIDDPTLSAAEVSTALIPTSDLLPILDPGNMASVMGKVESRGLRITTSITESQTTSITEVAISLYSDSSELVNLARDKYISALTTNRLRQITETLNEVEQDVKAEFDSQAERISEIDSQIAEFGNQTSEVNQSLLAQGWIAQSNLLALQQSLSAIEQVRNQPNSGVTVSSLGTVTQHSPLISRSVPLGSLAFLLTFGAAFVLPYFDRKIRSGADLIPLEIGDLLCALPQELGAIPESRAISILKSRLTTANHLLVAVDDQSQNDEVLSAILSKVGTEHNVRRVLDSEEWTPAPSDVVIIVASWGVSNVEDTELLARDLHQMGIQFGGWILVNVPPKDFKYVYSKSHFSTATY
jgi:hypothetical protein